MNAAAAGQIHSGRMCACLRACVRTNFRCRIFKRFESVGWAGVPT